MSDLNSQLRHNPIAIVGMGAIMPEARNLREFWNNIVGGVDCITDVPLSRWNVQDYYDPDPSAPDKTYCNRGGFMPDVDFDPLEFGLPPNILEVTDVSQMISLLVAKETLLDAGYLNAPEALRDRTGVILGVGGGQKLTTPLTSRLQYPVWNEVLESYGIAAEDRASIIERMKLAYIRWEENSFPGMLGNVIAGRITNRFDLGGTNCVVDAACAGTMAALKMALSELTDHRADMMITGGVDTDNSIMMYMCFSKTPAFSRGTHPRPFDIESDGMMVGEGIGMMALRRLEDAERDGDKIYAVIKGLGSSSDGRFKSIYAPRGEGQERALRRAYEDAGFSPATVGLIEAHGTGTVAGDTTEVTTIIRYFNQHDNQKQHVALGSVKSQIGHTKASAGAAGMIKTALSLHHKVLPPTLNVNTPNPKFDMSNSAFYVSGQARPWMTPSADVPRRAGVSSFGFGGTNFHVVMEEYKGDHKKAYRVHNTPQTVILNADTASNLRLKITEKISNLQGEENDRHFLNLVQQSRETALPVANARIGFVALNAEEAVTLLQTAFDMLGSKPDAAEWQHPKGVFYRRSGLDLKGRVVALFAGQGSQYLEMGRELALNFPEVRESFSRIDALMQRDSKATLSSVVYPPPSFSADEKRAHESALQGTDYAQPAIGALSAGMYRLFQHAGFRADFTAGHSFGELSALWAAGVLSDDDYDTLVKARGAAMAPPANDPNFDAGTMLAVMGDVEAIEREVANLPGVEVANHNSRTQVVVAGSKDAIDNAETVLSGKGFKAIPLSVSAAFHTPLVGHAQKPFADVINTVTFRAPQSPVYSNATGKAYPNDPATIKQMLAEHILKPVHFRDEIENLYAAGGNVFVEFGPRNVLTNLVKDILGDRPHVAIALNGSRQKDSDRQMREAAVQLQVLGLTLGAVDAYPMEREIAPKKKGMTVKLNGANYVSEKTRATYRDALASGGHITLNTQPVVPPLVTQAAPVVAQTIVPIPVQPSVPQAVAQPEAVEKTIAPQSEQVGDMNMTLQTLEYSLAQFREHQSETLRVHEQYAQSQSEYFRIFFELTQQQQSLLVSQAVAPNVAEALAQNMLRFHEYQAETLRMHEQYMQQQTQVAQSLLDIIRQQYGGLTYAPVHTNGNGSTNGNGNGAKPRAAQPLPSFQPAPVVPAPQAVKPVVVPPVAAPAPVKAPEPAKAAQPAPVAVQTPAPAPVAAPVPAAAPVAAVPSPAPVAAPAGGENLAALSEAMLRIVGDKTGYPVEMLELSMDMEADLGIDSIKRVEILGAMREEFPNLPQFSPEELGELRTLQQIVDYMQQRSGGTPVQAKAAVAAPAPVAAQPPAPIPVVLPVATVPLPAPVVAAPPAPAVAAASAGGESLAALSEAMLRIVGDKTGYPVEMLELSMDMEADLGIDSIKRVEILGAMREEFPNLPQFSPEELGELRTLQQIVDYMQQRSGGTPAPAQVVAEPATVVIPVPVAAQTPAPVPAASVPAPQAVPVSAPVTEGADLAALSEAMLRIVGDKTGYPVEMLELSMDMEADLGIDSIKRVEILGAMREEFPNLPQFSPEELGELRTLQQIVSYMEESSRLATPFDDGGSTQPSLAEDVALLEMAHNQINEVLPQTPIPNLHGIERNIVELRRLPTPDFQEFSVTNSVCVVTDDGTAATAAVANGLSAQGWRVVVLSLPQTVIPANSGLNGLAQVQLPDLEEASLQAALTSIASQYGTIGGYVHLNPAIATQNGTLFVEQEKAVVKFAFLMAKHLKAHLTRGNGTGRKCFITVTRLDGTLGTTAENSYGTILGGLFGLVKTLSLEWDNVFCRALDIAPMTNAEQVAQYILAELHDPNRLLNEVAYGAQGRTTLVTRHPHNNGTH